MWRDVLPEVIQKTLSGLLEELAAFGPRLLALVVILVLGALAAKAAGLVVRLLLPRLGFDRFAQRSGLSEVLGKGGIAGPPSTVVALAAAWGVFGVFVLLGIGVLDPLFARGLLAQAFAYLPHVLVAAAILVLGALVSAFLRRSVLIAAVNAGLPSARLLAGGVHTVLMILFAAMALEHLGVGRQVLLTSFAILFGGVVLALALSFGLAGRDLARELLERLARPVRPEKPDPMRHV